MKGLMNKDVGQVLQDGRMMPLLPFILSVRYSRLMGWTSSENVSFEQVLSAWGVTREELPQIKQVLQRGCLGFLAWVVVGFLIGIFARYGNPPHAAILEDFGIFMAGVALFVTISRGFLLLVVIREKPLRWWDLLTGNW